MRTRASARLQRVRILTWCRLTMSFFIAEVDGLPSCSINHSYRVPAWLIRWGKSWHETREREDARVVRQVSIPRKGGKKSNKRLCVAFLAAREDPTRLRPIDAKILLSCSKLPSRSITGQGRSEVLSAWHVLIRHADTTNLHIFRSRSMCLSMAGTVFCSPSPFRRELEKAKIPSSRWGFANFDLVPEHGRPKRAH